MGKTEYVDLEDPERLLAHSRRSFLTRGATGAAVAVAGGAALTALAASPAAAALGDVVLLAAPIRIFDSRPSAVFSGVCTGPGGTGSGVGIKAVRGESFRTVGYGSDSVDHIPSGSIGAFINVTCTQAEANGALGMTAAGTGSTSTSLINWISTGQVIANAALVPCAVYDFGGKNSAMAASNIHVVGGVNGVSKTHFIIDVFGSVAGS